MKKLALLFLLITAAAALTGCKGGVTVFLNDCIVYAEKYLYRGAGSMYLVEIRVIEENGKSLNKVLLRPLNLKSDTPSAYIRYGNAEKAITRTPKGALEAVLPFSGFFNIIYVTAPDGKIDEIRLSEAVPPPDIGELLSTAEASFSEELKREKRDGLKIKIKILAEDNFPSYYYVGFSGREEFSLLIDPSDGKVVTMRKGRL